MAVSAPAGGLRRGRRVVPVPTERPRDERQPDGCAVRRHRRSGSCSEVVGVDHDRGVPSGVADGGVQLAQRLEPDRVDAHAGEQRVVGCCDFLGAADEEGVPALARNRPSASVSPKHVRLQNGSRRAIRSPRSSMERKKAVDRARGALHNANTGTRAVYPRPGTPPRASTPACTARPGPSGTGCAPRSRPSWPLWPRSAASGLWVPA